MQNVLNQDPLWQAIQMIDLGVITKKLKKTKHYAEEYLDQLEIDYKQFLFLTVKFPEETIVPSEDVDELWHAHILDTRKYADDCESALGGFLHHFPYLGLRGEEDKKLLKVSFSKTNEKLHHWFGGHSGRESLCSADVVPYNEASQKVEASCHGNCSGAVAKPQMDIGVHPVEASYSGMCSEAVATPQREIGVKPVAAKCHGGCSGAVATPQKEIGVKPVAAKCHGGCSGAVAIQQVDIGVVPVTAKSA